MLVVPSSAQAIVSVCMAVRDSFGQAQDKPSARATLAQDDATGRPNSSLSWLLRMTRNPVEPKYSQTLRLPKDALECRGERDHVVGARSQRANHRSHAPPAGYELHVLELAQVGGADHTSATLACSRFGNDDTLLAVRVIARRTLLYFVESIKGHEGQKAARAALEAWFHEAQRAGWRNSVEVKRSYATASILSADRVVFNIKGNDYRLVTAIDYRRQIVFIKWLGTHRDYDKIDARTIQYAD